MLCYFSSDSLPNFAFIKKYDSVKCLGIMFLRDCSLIIENFKEEIFSKLLNYS